MLTHDFLNDNKIIKVTQAISPCKGSKIDVFYYVLLDGVWHRVHDDRLETAQDALKGTVSRYVRRIEESALSYFNVWTLAKAK